MSVAIKSPRTHVWLDGLGDWGWPGRGGVAAEVLPPSWVPAFPPGLERAATRSGVPAAGARSPSQPAIQRRLRAAALLSGLAAIFALLAAQGPLSLGGLASDRAVAPVALVAIASAPAAAAPPLPPLAVVGHGAAGSTIATVHYSSSALGGGGSFAVYLPPGYASTVARYPVLYLLHGNDQSARAFLQIGLQGELDRLIATRTIPPLIAVMIQGGRGANNWSNHGSRRYETYVLEVQELVDRMLHSRADRASRAIAGDSMGGYGAMNIALAHPGRFAVVESWLGFFNGLEGELRADRPILSKTPLRAFVYGGESDLIADPAENAPFAAALRAAGATATSAVYPGGHSLETLQVHLGGMLTFAGRALSSGTAVRQPGQRRR